MAESWNRSNTLKPTILVLHGAWHVPLHYATLQLHLESLGYPVLVPHLPTCNNADPPNSTLADDVRETRKIVEQLIADKKQCIVLMHSYGGMVGTEALHDLTMRFDSKDTSRPIGVIAMVYMCAFLPFEGESLASLLVGHMPIWLKPDIGSGFARIADFEMAQEAFYADLPQTEGERWIKELVLHPLTAQDTPVEHAAWRGMSGRLWYLLCTEDRAIPRCVQEAMIKRAQEEGGVKMHVEICDTGHSPFLSMPTKVGDVLQSIVN